MRGAHIRAIMPETEDRSLRENSPRFGRERAQTREQHAPEEKLFARSVGKNVSHEHAPEFAEIVRTRCEIPSDERRGGYDPKRAHAQRRSPSRREPELAQTYSKRQERERRKEDERDELRATVPNDRIERGAEVRAGSRMYAARRTVYQAALAQCGTDSGKHDDSDADRKLRRGCPYRSWCAFRDIARQRPRRPTEGERDCGFGERESHFETMPVNVQVRRRREKQRAIGGEGDSRLRAAANRVQR